MSEVIKENEINVTEKALKEIKRIMVDNKVPEGYGLRIGVRGGGCSGMTYTLGFDEKANEGDAVIEADSINIFVDGKSLFHITGIELDFTDGLTGKGFEFKNPNATRTCGCGESFGV